MLCSSGNEVVAKFGEKVPGILGSDGEVRDIVYTFPFDDGKEMDIEFAINTTCDAPFVVAMVYDHGECVGEFQPENPVFSFPGNFSVTVGNNVYRAFFGAEMEHSHHSFCMTDFLPDNAKTLRPDFLQIPEVSKEKLSPMVQQIHSEALEHLCSSRDWVENLDDIDKDCVEQYEFLFGRQLKDWAEYHEIDGHVAEMILDYHTAEEFFGDYPELKRYIQGPHEDSPLSNLIQSAEIRAAAQHPSHSEPAKTPEHYHHP